MNFNFVTRAVGATKLALQAHGPTLMVVGGVVSMGGAVITAGRQTLKVEEVLAKHTPDLEKIEQASSLEVESYGKEVARSDKQKVYVRAAFDLGKLYGVPIILFVGGAALVFGGHRVMLQRNASLALAFTGLERAFNAYRSRVRDQWGPEADQAMLRGHVVKEIINDDGSKTVIASPDWDETASDPYNRMFEQGETTEWQPDLGMNKFFLHNQQRFAQELLNRRGYLYLFEVYESLGFQATPISRLVGWKVRQLPDGSKDIPQVDFGLDKPIESQWIYGPDHSIYLDFNCQGLIIGGLPQKILERA